MGKIGDDQNRERHFPWEDVEAARANGRLQAKHSVDRAVEHYSSGARPCPSCGTPPRFLVWFYFSSPRWTWEHLCGREGWMTMCEWCPCQIDFFLEGMSWTENGLSCGASRDMRGRHTMSEVFQRCSLSASVLN